MVVRAAWRGWNPTRKLKKKVETRKRQRGRRPKNGDRKMKRIPEK
jgi:hypothetical protein